MYVTMMMTDQIPLDLAPPPLLNGDVPLMPHMVNGDAVQQVNNHTGAGSAHSPQGPPSVALVRVSNGCLMLSDAGGSSWFTFKAQSQQIKRNDERN